MVAANKRIDSDEAFAFLKVVAPKLEQLRRRLVAANELLESGDPETARLNAITESQLAVREFLGGIPHLSSLVAPIDALLDAVREEPEEPPPEDVAPPPPEPLAEPPAPPEPQIEPAPVKPVAPVADAPRPPTVDRWLQIGTVLAVQRLMAASMPEASAELYVRDAYAMINLRLRDASPITEATIKEWRSQFTSARRPGWRKTGLRRKAAGGVATLAEAKQRVAEMAATFKHMAELGAGN